MPLLKGLQAFEPLTQEPHSTEEEGPVATKAPQDTRVLSRGSFP